MSKVKVAAFSVSLDGFGAGINQDLKNPMGVNGMNVHQWLFPTKMFHQMIGKEGGEIGIDNDFAEAGPINVGATIMGRNMFGPIRGAWKDDEWKGWWGPNPPFHTQVFVLTHFARPSLEMEGGTTFHFVTDGIESALHRAKEAAGKKDVRIGGGVSVVRQYLKAGLIDEMHLAYSPFFLGQGESLFEGIDVGKLGYKVLEKKSSANATHVRLGK